MSDDKEVLYAVADFCLIPMGTGDSSVAEYIAECQTVLQKSGLTFKSAEGPWNEVCKAIHDCHAAVHQLGAPRIATDIRIGTRTDREAVLGEGNNRKVRRVEEILASKQGEPH
ncbi:YkoF-like protein [Pisolithus croceorrhizus]|nr:YkoF-like protein [Pisolithus croceorrhizus]KAI6131980.1 YkoF-like protein [Pisolithus croceorrhizus]KAI6166895.1 YkoF-like protein [Pisolithus thermaeus]